MPPRWPPPSATLEAFARGRDMAAWLGLDAAQDDDRRQAAPARHHQARQSIPSEEC